MSAWLKILTANKFKVLSIITCNLLYYLQFYARMPPLSTTATAATFYLPWPVPALPLPRRPGAGHLSCVDTPRQSRVQSKYLHVSRYGYLDIYTSLDTDTYISTRL